VALQLERANPEELAAGDDENGPGKTVIQIGMWARLGRRNLPGVTGGETTAGAVVRDAPGAMTNQLRSRVPSGEAGLFTRRRALSGARPPTRLRSQRRRRAEKADDMGDGAGRVGLAKVTTVPSGMTICHVK
jgi:hypothetical protein